MSGIIFHVPAMKRGKKRDFNSILNTASPIGINSNSIFLLFNLTFKSSHEPFIGCYCLISVSVKVQAGGLSCGKAHTPSCKPASGVQKDRSRVQLEILV